MQKNKGITLLEILVTVAILSVLLSIGYASFRRLKAKYELSSAAQRLYTDIEWCRQKSMASLHPYGLYITSNSYKVFEDTNNNGKFDSTGDTVLKEATFNHVTLSGYPTSNNNSYIYTRRGTPTQSFTLTLTNQYNHTKHITISMFKTRIE